ncbi:MAG: ABC transporter substrate-binding protein [Fibrobacteraceae bacterium]|nr:ABC transporter substrate-binding protein [Fibrobacteraceae bacterium]
MNANKKALLFCVPLIGLALIGVERFSHNAAPEIGMNDTRQNDRMIIDMAGRKIKIPDSTNRISALHPVPCHMVWRLAPEKLISIDKQFKERFSFLSSNAVKDLFQLPVTAEFHVGVSREQILKIKPDIVISLSKDPNLDKEQTDFLVPVVATSKNSLDDYEKSWRFIGELVGNAKEGNELADYWHGVLTKVTSMTSKIPDKKRLKVYFAQSNINSTVGNRTIMASIIRSAGGINFYDVNPLTAQHEENESIVTPMEEILQWNPDVIITCTGRGRDEILLDPKWATINAVRNKRVYASLNFERLDGIPCLLGLVWTATTLYPDIVKLDFEKETKTFFSKIFLNDRITRAQIYEERN